MLDVMGAISLTALFGLCCGVLIGSSPGGTAARPRLAAVAVLWFAGVGSLAALGLFSAAGAGTPAIGTAILVPIVVSLWAVRRSPALRAVALGTPLTALVAAHAGRVLGFFFLLLFAAGRLPPTFAMAAGWGDIVVAIAALPLVWAIHRRVNGWRTLTLAWNLFGFVDLVTAVTLGVGSASDSPARFIFESPSTDAMGFLPWLLIPGVLVPLYLLTHLAIFAQLARSGSDAEWERIQVRLGPDGRRRAARLHGASTILMKSGPPSAHP